ncbi:hypothetical protein BB560_001350 [Smittium megazygosporum]|uniref:BCNT-C domain-containing protein n=1 Tax=Smittium megazygosporum TaxID=133381 RepID=A0A2T9ZHU4_9FUNG|nr:hypothetical protein BB560_001350 [Smittium megazygosporum]
MSLEQLYTEEFSENDSDSSFGSEEIAGISSSESESDSDYQDEQDQKNIAECSSTVEKELERKRKVEELWNEMNEPISKKHISSETIYISKSNLLNGKQKNIITDNSSDAQPSRTLKGSIAVESSSKFSSVENKPENEQNKNSNDETLPKATAEEADQPQEQDSEIPKDEFKLKPSKFSEIEAQVNSTLGKKLNTVQKSKLQWDSFTKKEDITHILDKRAKDGYVEKLDFLDRAYKTKTDYLSSLKK